ncbi:DUF499 domain-containing protein [bacterium]|nr:DUF499 domain-containing protein [bacterium]
MQSILKTCKPRPDIISGSFNPEIFTASLSQVMNCYRGRAAITHPLYTDGEQFFREATYPTDGLRLILSEVFGRLSGDNSMPAIHRLETAFGGGKTHVLIALAHLGFKGMELSGAASGMVDGTVIHSPGDVSVAGIAGDELPVHKTRGTGLVPYTLWGEIAYQIGGEALYKEVEEDAESLAAPGEGFFNRIFDGRKALILMDELAQYATRLEASSPNGGEQLAAFLMGLHGYARTHSGIAVVFTLASQADAFSRQTKHLADLLSKDLGRNVDEEEAVGLAQRAERGTRSVAARDSVTVVPVQAAEISRVLSKRLFDSIDIREARNTASEYMAMYQRNVSMLPDRATREDFHETITAHYPFHPVFIEFLNSKLATVETFQGTRGVLRVLALTIRNLWNKGKDVPMVHTCHLDLRDARTINEILGRTGRADLLAVLNTDIGGADTPAIISAGKSQAELADQRNPHPAGFPLHEYAWKVVFLHSLVGRAEGMDSNLFGITERDALFETSFPVMTPPQVEAALREIENSAYYLRLNKGRGRYYASLEPSINRALNDIRQSLHRDPRRMDELLAATARKVVRAENSPFRVVHDVSEPGHVPDKTNIPVLALIALDEDEIDCEEFITTLGPNRARSQQNMVFLLVPETVHVKGEPWNDERAAQAKEAENRLRDLSCEALALRRLNDQPENYGITPSMLMEQEFDTRLKERELALITAVTQTYNGIRFTSASGQVTAKEIKSGGGEGGLPVIEEVRRVLKAEGEMITSDAAVTKETISGLSRVFFETEQAPSLERLREEFACNRRWPVLEHPSIFEQIIRAGVRLGEWCLFRMAGTESIRPEELFSRESNDVPLHIDISASGWSLVTLQGAAKRGWIGTARPDPVKVERWVSDIIGKENGVYVHDIVDMVIREHGEIPEDAIIETVGKLVHSDRLITYKGKKDQQERPRDLIHGAGAIVHKIKPDDCVLTPSEASKRGWVSPQSRQFRLEGSDGARRIIPMLGRIGSLYSKGAHSVIKALDLSDLEIPGGGRLRVCIEDTTPEGMKMLGEFFETLAMITEQGDATEGYLEITNPDSQCPFIQELKKGGGE